jgi:trigger factor
MQTTNTPLPRSRLQIEFELPAERLTRSLDDAARRLSQQHRISGFRPGKAPRAVVERVVGASTVMDEAVDLLVENAVREAVRDQEIAPLASPEVEVTQAEEGKPVIFKATLQVRPEIKLGDFENFPFKPEVEPVDETMVEKVVDDLRDGEGHLEPVEGRAAGNGDYVIVAFDGTRDGAKFTGGSSERMPLVLGQNRLYPGFEDHIVGMWKGEDREFDIDIPENFQVEWMRGAHLHFKLKLKELRGKVVPEADDEFARSVGRFKDLADLKVELRKRLEENALDRARHEFADRIVDYAAANATIDLPDILVDQEVEVMRDEMRSALARQGISDQAYFKATGKTDAEARAEFRPQAEKRAKSLLTLAEISKVKGVEVSEAEVEVEVGQARSRYANDRSLIQFFESERGRNSIRNTIRQSRTVEQLVDEWLTAHPEAPRLRHIEDAGPGSTVETVPVEAAASAGMTAPESLTRPAASAPGA